MIFLALHTKKLTDFISVTNWFYAYKKLSQRVSHGYFTARKKQIDSENTTIRDSISEFGRLFGEDLERLLPLLETNTHYRVNTHYSDIINKAVEKNIIKLLREPIKLKRRMVHELRPLLGFKDYHIMKRCRKKSPAKERCCERCVKCKECQCKRGGVCSRAALKTFYQYDFMVAKSDESEE